MTTNQELATQNQETPGVLAQAGGAVDYSGLHKFDERLPLLKLAPMVSADHTPGWFYRTDTGEEFETLRVLVARLQPQQVLWPAGEINADKKPVCWSNDAIAAASQPRPGSDAMPLYPGRACQSCPARWVPRAGAGKPRPGQCEPVYVAFLVDVETFAAYMMSLHGTGRFIAPTLDAAARSWKTVTLSALRKPYGTSAYWALKATIVPAVTPEDVIVIAQSYRGEYTAKPADVVEGPDVDESFGGADANVIPQATHPAVDEALRQNGNRVVDVAPAKSVPPASARPAAPASTTPIMSTQGKRAPCPIHNVPLLRMPNDTIGHMLRSTKGVVTEWCDGTKLWPVGSLMGQTVQAEAPTLGF